MFGRFSPFLHSFVCLFVHMLSNHLNIFIRDVKPENLLVGSPGTPTESIIHMVYNLTTNHNDCFCPLRCLSLWQQYAYWCQWQIAMTSMRIIWIFMKWFGRWTLAWQPRTRMTRAPTYFIWNSIFWLGHQGAREIFSYFVIPDVDVSPTSPIYPFISWHTFS